MSIELTGTISLISPVIAILALALGIVIHELLHYIAFTILGITVDWQLEPALLGVSITLRDPAPRAHVATAFLAPALGLIALYPLLQPALASGTIHVNTALAALAYAVGTAPFLDFAHILMYDPSLAAEENGGVGT